MEQKITITEENFEEIKKDASNGGLRLISIIEEYERILMLNCAENPIMDSDGHMIDKVNKATRLFVEKFEDKQYLNSELVNLINQFSVLGLRLGNLILDLIGKREVVLLPSKRNYLYMSKAILMGTLENMVEHKKIADPNISSEALKVFTTIAEKADSNSQVVLEFRIINILIIFLTIFIDDRQTISFLSYLMKTQEEISIGGV